MKRLLFSLVILSMVLVPSAVHAASQAPDAPWTWRWGVAGHTRYDWGYPYYQIEIGATTFYTQCTTIQYCDSAGCVVIDQTVTGNGHWQKYSPFGTAQGSHFYHTGVAFYVLNWLDGADVENPHNYKAFCSEYTPQLVAAGEESLPNAPNLLALPPLPGNVSSASANNTWYYGSAATYRYDWGYPYIQIKIGTPNDSYFCNNIQFWYKAGYWGAIPLFQGHWQDYYPWGGWGWGRYYHLSKQWYTDRYKEQENVRNPGYYVASCIPF